MNLELIGINKGKITQFNRKGIETVEDLVKFLPRKYYDFRNPIGVKQAKEKDGEYISIVGTVIDIIDTSKNNGTIRVKIQDNMNSYMYIVFFNQNYVAKIIKRNIQYIFCGKIQVKKEYGNMVQMVNPIDFSHQIEGCKRILPLYSKIQGMSEAFLIKSMNSALSVIDKTDYIEPELLRKYGIITYSSALRSIHQPSTMEDIDSAKKRFLFDDLFLFNFHLTNKNQYVNSKSTFVMEKFNNAKEFMDSLPFKLTEGQRIALRQMSVKMKSGGRLNALVQGDVGCGKTTVATLLMIIACNNGYQSALMAPLSVLAKQHYEEIKEKVAPLGFKVGFLSGEQSVKEKREVLKGVKSGDIHMVVGTHAILGNNVEFDNLAMVISDEEHKFGVAQRDTLKQKADTGVHVVNMSATPIPRTLAMSIHGDNVDVITIKSLPKGRQPIETIHVNKAEDAYIKMSNEVSKGRQCFVVCPFIEENENSVENVDETYAELKKYFSGTNVRVGMVVGGKKMSESERKETLSKFNNHEYDILVSTTIIEVGVNIPNATVILIKNAERFGLSQLHQLRGRVGRGNHKSYCLLLANTTNIEAEKKIGAMCETTDGFIIAQRDLEIRGMGDFLGTQQSGSNKYVMLMLANPDLNMKIKEEVKTIYSTPVRYNKYKGLLDMDITDK